MSSSATLLPGSPGTGAAELDSAVICGDEAKLQGASFESLVDEDNRKLVGDVHGYPWRMICSLERLVGSEWRPYGTGWLAGPRTVITAGHCVRDVSLFRSYGKDGWLPKVRVVPGRKMDEPQPYGAIEATQFDASDEWKSAASSQDEFARKQHDYGAIFLPEPVAEIGYFAVQQAEPEELTGLWVTVSGYPLEGDPEDMERTFDGRSQYFHAEKISRVRDGFAYYANDATRGQSGSPVIRRDSLQDHNPKVVAIHAYGKFDENEGNRGPVIRNEVFARIGQWVNHPPEPPGPGSEPDSQPKPPKPPKRQGFFARVFGGGGRGREA